MTESVHFSRFADRHIGTSPADRQVMLKTVGVPSLEALMDGAMPEVIRSSERLALPDALSESDALNMIWGYASQNVVMRNLIGLGYHDVLMPAVIRRNILENPAWYTAYTPYQPEISQGRLEALLNFQTVISDLTGLDISGSSLLDESTAAAEAMLLARRSAKRGASDVFIVDENALPQTLSVLATRAQPVGIELHVTDTSDPANLPEAAFGILLQYPGANGVVADFSATIARAKELNAAVIMATDPLALTMLTPPGELGADIAVGSAQRFGVPLGFGGPHAGFMAVKEGLQRQLPGRLVGVSRDASQAPALRLALQTREQHIRREKATSNICTAQVLLAVIASAYAAWHGPAGLAAIARDVHAKARTLAEAFSSAGLELAGESFFDTVTVSVPGRAEGIVQRAAANGVNVRLVDVDTVGIAVNEATTDEEIGVVLEAFGLDASPKAFQEPALPSSLRRSSQYLTHPVFNAYHSETAMMRYLRRLSDFDFALDRGMIPLGSCTMKLNAAAEMEPISWPNFAAIHPLAPEEQTRGWRHLIEELEGWLAEVCGYAKVSVQPNAGSQGELAGLLAIAAWQKDRGEGHRDVCLIPASAHGTNAASAILAGMRVVVVKCDDDGNIDLVDLDAKIEKHRGDLAAIMVTYPSTHGVYEESIANVCSKIHDAGGQVYVDGANLNALLGWSKPGRFGADVSHLNLHKTFCIPHGGGGPGVGPVAVREHLAPFVPGDPMTNDAPVGAVSQARWGSAGILPIPWMYLRMMGPEGLVEATASAVLAANYVAARLRDHFPILYKGRGGLVAHECILDLRELTKHSGVTVDDVAKRLIDFGFHAPTMSFPVAGTLMMEPTESEDLDELDRFCEAMIAIRAEIDEVTQGKVAVEDSALRHAPHTAAVVTDPQWDRSYSRQKGAYPAGVSPAKYWPPVSRVDNAWGDRNLACSCPSLDAYSQ
ncbi:aminomethyl-transferring glycine dehydrogenase [Natronoglycomyces albus]|uniref:Glycine dehydrogenase (decarboxylating) n=1 Tax=Natronoglycomyces albus TaxID=2811108 RepID=A0A895XTM0_9ACTN|nr:aminomethyl-transferring glycine dehydrogenase [Natronoglycomyces albus]QSB06833.1 aminomethyl-transferring glycine dehydrogenase [Natronoglycomyces albus]